MGYRPYYANYFGFIVQEDERDTAYDLMKSDGATVFGNVALTTVGDFEGADSRIDECPPAIVLRKYTKSTYDDNLKGDINGVPTEAELQEVQAFCQKYGFTYLTPERVEVNFIW